MRRNQRRPELLVAVWAEVGATRIEEAWIEDRKHFVDGLCEHGRGGVITVNPMRATVDTLVHEILHRLKPCWSENYVRRTTTYLIRRMTDQEIQSLFTEYQRRKRVRASVKKTA